MQIVEKKHVSKYETSRDDRMFRAVKNKLDNLNEGEALVIMSDEWRLKSKPNVYIHQSMKRKDPEKKFEVRQLWEKKGWIITRVK